jgi:ATP-dependent Clp protease ATP-binding subunit ClpA
VMLSDALFSIGISFEDILREAGDRKIPYSPRARDVLVGARKEMRRLADGYLGTEHILLGIMGNEDGAAVRILAGMGVSSEALEDRLYELRGRAAG